MFIEKLGLRSLQLIVSISIFIRKEVPYSISPFKPSPPSQSEKTEGFCVTEYAIIPDERILTSKIFPLLNEDKRTLRSKICKGRMLDNSRDLTN